jgi:hypothetical protein
MRILTCLLIFSCALFGQAAFTTEIGIDDIGDSHARIMWMTDIDVYKTAHWGTAAGTYTNIVTPSTTHQVTNWHAMYLSGLPSNTTVYARACVAPATATFTVNTTTDVITASAGTWVDATMVLVWLGTSSVGNSLTLTTGLGNSQIYYVRDASGLTFKLAATPGGSAIDISGTLPAYSTIGYATCSAEFSFQTLNETTVQLPTAPAVPELPAYPTISESFVVSSCSQVVSKYDEWKNNVDGLHREIRVPASFRCGGKQTFGTRTGTGWIVIRSDEDDSALPPEGSRTREEFLANYATFVQDGLPMSSNGSASTAIKSTSLCSVRGAGDLLGFASVVTPAASAYNPAGITTVARCVSGTTTFTASVVASAKTVDGSDLLVDTATPHGCAGLDYGVLDLNGGTIAAGDGLARRITIVDSDTVRFHQLADQTLTGSSVVACNQSLAQMGTYVAAGSLSTAGTTCTVDGEMQVASQTEVRWCVKTDDLSGLVWRAFRNTNGSDSPTINPPFNFDFGAKYIRVGPGIRVTFNQLPTTLVSLWRDGVHQDQGRTSGLIYTTNTTDNIIFDRTEINGVGYPARHGSLVQLHGSNFFLTNSRLYGAENWIDTEQTADEQGSSMVQTVWATKQRFENNYISCAGICLFWPESKQDQMGTITEMFGAASSPPTDILVRRNTFYRNPTLMSGSTAGVTERYDVRHFVECKRCTNFAAIGNIFDGHWSSATQGAPILMTPIPGASLAVPIYNVTSITDNVITFSGTAARDLRGANDQAAWGSYVTEGMMIAVIGTTGPDSATHNGKIVQLLDVDHTANPTTATIVGAALAGSSTGGTATLMASDVSTSDVEFSYNTFVRLPYITTANGHNIIAQGSIPNTVTRQSRRFRMHNNLAIAPNKRRCITSGGGETAPITECTFVDYGYNELTGIHREGRSFNFWLANHGIAHGTITNNTVVDARGNDIQSFIEADITKVGQGNNSWLRAENNLWLSMADVHGTPDAYVGFSLGGSALDTREGTTSGLDGVWGSGRWSFKRNVFCCENTRAGYYTGDAADNKWLTSNTIVWKKYTRPDVTTLTGAQRRAAWDDHIYQLRYDSPFKSGATGVNAMKGTDGKDIGVDYKALLREQGQVRNARAISPTSSGITIAYTAPDTTACTIEVSTSASWGTGTRTTSTGGYYRATAITGLDADTAYYARVLCAVEQPEVTFRTQP